MALEQTDIFRLIDGIYDAAFNERRWQDVVCDIENIFAAPGACIIDVDLDTGAIGNMISNQLMPKQDEYVARMNAINPRMQRSLQLPGPHIAVDYDGMPESAICKHEFYDWMQRECGVKYYIGSRMLEVGSIASFTSVEFTPRHGHASAEEIELFRMLVPHIANAWRLSGKLSCLQAEADIAAQVAERVNVAVFGLALDGAIVSANTLAERVLSAADGLLVRDRQIHACKAAIDRRLQQVIGAALQSVVSRNGNVRHIMAIPRPSQKRDYLLEISACTGRHQRQPPNVPVVFLLVTDPEAGSIDPALLQTLYGLTLRESQLAAILHDGCDLQHAAIELGIAYNTARIHLGQVLKKTGCSARPELVALLNRLPLLDGNNVS